MESIIRALRRSLRSGLQRVGLDEYARQVKGFLQGRKRYRAIKTFDVTINGVTVLFSTEDEYSNCWFFPRYAGGKIHERKVTETLMGALSGAKCFVDVGANIGWYTCLACKHMPQGKVYGFEMDDLNFALLRKNLELNEFDNVEVHNVAVSDAAGVMTYQREKDRPNPAFQLNAADTAKRSRGLVSVKTITLDDFFQSREHAPDVMKIDVEGAEMSVLRGMSRIMADSKPILFLEVHPRKLPMLNASLSGVLSLLIDNGYTLFEIEDMRGHQTSTQRRALSRDTVLKRNTMLYAVAE